MIQQPAGGVASGIGRRLSSRPSLQTRPGERKHSSVGRKSSTENPRPLRNAHRQTPPDITTGMDRHGNRGLAPFVPESQVTAALTILDEPLRLQKPNEVACRDLGMRLVQAPPRSTPRRAPRCRFAGPPGHGPAATPRAVGLPAHVSPGFLDRLAVAEAAGERRAIGRVALVLRLLFNHDLEGVKLHGILLATCNRCLWHYSRKPGVKERWGFSRPRRPVIMAAAVPSPAGLASYTWSNATENSCRSRPPPLRRRSRSRRRPRCSSRCCTLLVLQLVCAIFFGLLLMIGAFALPILLVGAVVFAAVRVRPENVPLKRMVVDLLFGVVVPVSCLVIAPGLLEGPYFRPWAGGQRLVCGPFEQFLFAAISVQMVAFLAWRLGGRWMHRGFVALLAGGFWFGVVLAGGIVLLYGAGAVMLFFWRLGVQCHRHRRVGPRAGFCGRRLRPQRGSGDAPGQDRQGQSSAGPPRRSDSICRPLLLPGVGAGDFPDLALPSLAETFLAAHARRRLARSRRGRRFLRGLRHGSAGVIRYNGANARATAPVGGISCVFLSEFSCRCCWHCWRRLGRGGGGNRGRIPLPRRPRRGRRAEIHRRPAAAAGPGDAGGDRPPEGRPDRRGRQGHRRLPAKTAPRRTL